MVPHCSVLVQEGMLAVKPLPGITNGERHVFAVWIVLMIENNYFQSAAK